MLSSSSLVRGVSVLAMVSCCAVPAFAADLGVGGGFKDGPGYAPLWQGFYIGLNAGGIADGKSDYNFPLGGYTPDNKNTADLKGMLGGLQAGYNAQFGHIVAGIEADGGFAKTDSPTYSINQGANMETQLNSTFTVRGRLGATLRPNLLFYGTGGYAIANVDHSLDFGGQLFKDSGTIQGWVAGGGLEYMHSSRLSFGVELLHYDFGQDRFNLTYTGPATSDTIPTDIDTAMTTVRGRLSFHLD
jgi:outer membrane immunogenic protein